MPPRPPRSALASILLFCILIPADAFSQKKANPKIGKNEMEISSFILGDDFWAVGGQLVYRLSVVKKLKIGAGFMYGANYETDPEDPFGYGALFADAMQFLGQREKWSFGGQLGQGIYNPENSFVPLKADGYWSISCNYRAIISRKILFNTSLLIGKRSFHWEDGSQTDNAGFIGLKFGVVF